MIRAVALYLLVLSLAYAAIVLCMIHNAKIERRQHLVRRIQGER